MRWRKASCHCKVLWDKKRKGQHISPLLCSVPSLLDFLCHLSVGQVLMQRVHPASPLCVLSSCRHHKNCPSHAIFNYSFPRSWRRQKFKSMYRALVGIHRFGEHIYLDFWISCHCAVFPISFGYMYDRTYVFLFFFSNNFRHLVGSKPNIWHPPTYGLPTIHGLLWTMDYKQN